MCFHSTATNISLVISTRVRGGPIWYNNNCCNVMRCKLADVSEERTSDRCLLLTLVSRSRIFFYSEVRGDTFLRNVGSHKLYTAPDPKKRYSSHSHRCENLKSYITTGDYWVSLNINFFARATRLSSTGRRSEKCITENRAQGPPADSPSPRRAESCWSLWRHRSSQFVGRENTKTSGRHDTGKPHKKQIHGHERMIIHGNRPVQEQRNRVWRPTCVVPGPVTFRVLLHARSLSVSWVT
jgi:hypothetical protein